jgi:hypothetical protein
MNAPATKEKESTRLIDARGAAQLASKYFKSLLPQVSDFSLEEVELSEDGKFWLITLGFSVSDKKLPTGNWAAVLGSMAPRTKFKVFKVDAQTGKVLSMKIRALQ